MDHEIKLTADVRDVEKAVSKAKKSFKEFGKEANASFKFTGDFKKLVDGHVEKQIKILRSTIKSAEQDFKSLVGVGGAISAKNQRQANEILDTIKQRKQEISKLQAGKTLITGRGETASGLASGLMNMARGGGIGGLISGLGGVAIPAAIVGALGYGARKAWQTESGIAPHMVRFAGYGYGERAVFRGIRNPALRHGYNYEQAYGMGTEWLQGMGHLGGFREALAATRGYGLDFGQMAQMGGTARRLGGDQRKNFIDMMSEGVATGLEDAKLGDYLKTQTGLLEEFVSKGPVNAQMITGLLSTLTGKGGEYFKYNPEAGARAISSLNQMFQIQGAGGPGFGVLAPEIMKQFPGVKGAFDIEAMTALGLFGGGKQLRQMNLPKGMQNWLGGMGAYGEEFGSKSMKAMYNYAIEGKTGAETYALLGKGQPALEMAGLLEAWKKAPSQEEKKKRQEEFSKVLKEKTEATEENSWFKVIQSEAHLAEIKKEVTEKVVPYLAALAEHFVPKLALRSAVVGAVEGGVEGFQKDKGLLDKYINPWIKNRGIYKWFSGTGPNEGGTSANDPYVQSAEGVGPGEVSYKNKKLVSEFAGLKKTAPELYETVTQKLGGATLTSVASDIHSVGSKHYLGQAVDIRTKDLEEARKQEMLDVLTGQPNIKAFLEGAGTSNEHIHAELRKAQAQKTVAETTGTGDQGVVVSTLAKISNYLHGIQDNMNKSVQKQDQIKMAIQTPRGNAPDTAAGAIDRSKLFN